MGVSGVTAMIRGHIVGDGGLSTATAQFMLFIFLILLLTFGLRLCIILFIPPINCRVYLKVLTWMDYELRVKVSGKQRDLGTMIPRVFEKRDHF